MRDIDIGSIDRTQVKLRCWAPWTPGSFSSFRWLRHCFRRYSWRLYCGHLRRDDNFRCYCPVGWSWFGQIIVAGFGLNVWVSIYGGPTPCGCEPPPPEEHGDGTR